MARYSSFRRRRLLTGVSALLLPLVPLGGCGGSGVSESADLPASATPGERSLSRERAALRDVLDQPISEARRDSLLRAALDPLLPHADRDRALRALLEQDEAAAAAAVRRLLTGLPDVAWAEDLCALAAERAWVSCAGPLVWRAYRLHDPVAEQFSASQRAAVEAVQRLSGTENAAEALWSVVRDASQTAVVRAGAWELYVRVATMDAARNRLFGGEEGLDQSAGLLADFSWCAEELHTVPATLEEIIRLQALLLEEAAGHAVAAAPEQLDRERRWADLAAGLHAAQRRGLLLRHFPVLEAAHQCRPDLLTQQRVELLTDLRHRLAHARHVTPQPGGMVASDLADDLGAWEKALAFCDLISLSLVLDALADPTFAAALHEQVELDLANNAGERGGLVRLAPPHGARRGCLVLEPFTSESESLGDMAFQPPPRMWQESYTAVAEYHFHAQSRDNRRSAGPGRGDLRYAARTGSACLLITPCGRDGLNVDFFARLPSGRVAVVDLGTIP